MLRPIIANVLAIGAILTFGTACASVPRHVGIFTIQSTAPLARVHGLVETLRNSMYFAGMQDGLERVYQTAPGDAPRPISTDSSWPNVYAIAPSRDGSVWFTARDSARKFYVVRLGGGLRTLTETHGSAFRITAAPDGSAWFTETSNDEIGHISAAGRLTEYKISNEQRRSGPWDITFANDGNVWFTLTWANAIGRITPNGNITEFPVPTADSRPFGIAAGRDGNLWFTELTANKIGRITPTGQLREYADPALRDNPSEIAAGKDGELWFCEVGSIGRILLNGEISVRRAPLGTCSGVAEDEQRNVWFTQNIPGPWFSGSTRTALASFKTRKW